MNFVFLLSKVIIRLSRLLILLGCLSFAVLAFTPESILNLRDNSYLTDNPSNEITSQKNPAESRYDLFSSPQMESALFHTTLTAWQEGLFKTYCSNLNNIYELIRSNLKQSIDPSIHIYLYQVLLFLLKNSFDLIFSIGFIFLVTAPFALIFIAFRIAYGMFNQKRERTDDLMGFLTNGRLFFSGLMVNSSIFDKEGRPNLLVPNLVLLPKESPALIWNAEITKLLQEHGVWNKTTQALLGFILEKSETPAFIPDPKDQEFYNKSVEEMSIEEATKVGIQEVLKLVDELRDGKIGKIADSLKVESRESKGSKQKPAKIDLVLYRELLRNSLIRIMPKELREDLNPQQAKKLLILLVLALAVGKILTSKRTGNSWSKTSIFPELSARAAVHSIISYPEEYSSIEQTDIRRALVCCSRYSPISVTRQPLDMSLLSFTLRQCGELLLTNPLRIQTVADEVEFHGLLFILHTRWSAGFYERLKSFDKETIADALSINSKALLIKIKSLVRILKSSVDETTISRAGALINQIHQQNQLHKRSAEFSQEENSKEYQKQLIFDPPLSFSEMKRFADDHQLSLDDLKNWSILKNVLSYYGWLSRRVGDSPVSSQSISFYVVKINIKGGPSSNDNKAQRRNIDSKNFLSTGKTGMVALRGDRLFDKFGEIWASRFTDIKDIMVFEKKDKMEMALERNENKVAE